jgi:hypothetical protein
VSAGLGNIGVAGWEGDLGLLAGTWGWLEWGLCSPGRLGDAQTDRKMAIS